MWKTAFKKYEVIWSAVADGLADKFLETNEFPYVRSTHWRCSVKKGVFRNFAKFTRKHLCWSLFLNKVSGLRPTTLLKERLWHICFPVNFAKFLGTLCLQNTFGRLLLSCIETLDGTHIEIAKANKHYSDNDTNDNITKKRS